MLNVLVINKKSKYGIMELLTKSYKEKYFIIIS